MRQAGPADAEAIDAIAIAGFESYREFAGPGFRPPGPRVEFLREHLAAPETWAMLAEDSGAVVGVVAFRPMLTERWSGEPVPGLAHFWMLFVSPDSWGRRIGRTLHDVAVAEIVTRGYRRARLWTPVGAERARALYRSAGWVETGSTYDSDIGLDLIVYELDIEKVRRSRYS
jgi:ribosomal protein S18 acetylase RimI-like enzyme